MTFSIREIRDEEHHPSTAKKFWWRFAGMVRSLWALCKNMRVRAEQSTVSAKRTRLLQGGVTALIGILCTLLVLAGAVKILLATNVLSLSGILSAAGAPLPTDQYGFTNVLLLGEGDKDHDGVDLTDTIMVASLDPTKTKSAVLLSIPRDLYILDGGKMGAGRINSLYRNYKSYLRAKGKDEATSSKEALNELAVEVGQFIGLQIHGVVKINFSGFEQAIDSIGGIDVDVTQDLVDPEYPGPNYTYETFSIQAGMQHLDGATALKYARSRHSTSDFSRSMRQQQIISATAKKATDAGLLTNVSRITDLLSIVARNMESTFTTRQLLSLVAMGKKIDTSKMVSLQLNDAVSLYGDSQAGAFLYAPPREDFEGASVLLPLSYIVSPKNVWDEIRTFVALGFLERTVFVQPPTVVVLNMGAKEGMARRLGNELARYGFNVTKTHNYDKGLTPPISTSFVAIATPPPVDAAKDITARTERTRDLLAKTLRLQPLTINPPQPFDGSPDIVITVGKDYTFSSLSTLVHRAPSSAASSSR